MALAVPKLPKLLALPRAVQDAIQGAAEISRLSNEWASGVQDVLRALRSGTLDLDERVTELEGVEPVLSEDTVNLWLPDAPPASAHSKDDEFTASGLDAKWSEWDPGAYQTVAMDTAAQQVKITGTGNGADRWGGIYQSVPAGSEYAIYAKMDMCSGADVGVGRWTQHALFVAADISGSPATAAFYTAEFFSGNSAELGYIGRTWTNYQTAGATSLQMSNADGYVLYGRIRVNGVNIAMDVSPDGIAWLRIGALALGAAPLYMGVGLNSFLNANEVTERCSFFRVFEGAGTSGFHATKIGRLCQVIV